MSLKHQISTWIHTQEVAVTRVFVVQHVHLLPDGTEDVKLIGVYSTKKSAGEAVERARTHEGFKAAPNGFAVDEYVLDEDEWKEGFVTC